MSLTQRKWWLNKYFQGQEMNLSERITRLAFQDQVAETIRINMDAGTKLLKMSSEIKEFSNNEDVAKWVRSIEKAGRKASSGDESALNEFKGKIKSMKKEIESGIESGDATKLDKAYLKVIEAAESLNDSGLDSAIENALNEKAAYNAYRIALTETNRAYNMGIYTRALNDEDVEAIQLDLSYLGNNCDECTELSEQDNGAGPGIYPLDQVPETPIHPNCRCILSPVYKLPEGVESDDLEVKGDFEVMEKLPNEIAA